MATSNRIHFDGKVFADGHSATDPGSYDNAAQIAFRFAVRDLSGDTDVDAVSITVKHSDDDETFAAAADTAAFDEDGEQLVTVDNPKRYVRVDWDVSGTNPQPHIYAELAETDRQVADVYERGPAPAAPIDVDGARDDPEAALANLLTALDSAGIITDSTTDTAP